MAPSASLRHMHTPSFVVPIAELEARDRELDAPLEVEWLERALSGTEATPRARPGRVRLRLSMSGRDVVVAGSASAEVTLPCARTLDSADYDLHTDIYLLLSPASALPHGPQARRPRPAESKPGVGRHGRKRRGSEERALSREDAGLDTYDGDQVVLDDFIREHLLLELPLMPLRSDLRSEASPAIAPPSAVDEASRVDTPTVDPRLAPLAEIAKRLRETKE